MSRFISVSLVVSVAVSGVVSPAVAEDWEGAKIGLCRFKASTEKSDDLTEVINFQLKPSLRGGDKLDNGNFRLHDPGSILKGAIPRQMGFDGQVMSLASRSEADKQGSPVIALLVTISNPPKKYNHAAIISGTLGDPKSSDTLYVGMCSLQQVEAGADLMWQAATEEASKPE